MLVNFRRLYTSNTFWLFLFLAFIITAVSGVFDTIVQLAVDLASFAMMLSVLRSAVTLVVLISWKSVIWFIMPINPISIILSRAPIISIAGYLMIRYNEENKDRIRARRAKVEKILNSLRITEMQDIDLSKWDIDEIIEYWYWLDNFGIEESDVREVIELEAADRIIMDELKEWEDGVKSQENLDSIS